MANERGEALITVDTYLSAQFRLHGVLTDPFAVRQVEILDTDGATVLETIAAVSITNLAVGIYRVTAAGGFLDTVGPYHDKWYWTAVDGDAEQTITQGFYVGSVAAPEEGRLTGLQQRDQVAAILRRSDLGTLIDQWHAKAIQDVYVAVKWQGLESLATFDTTADVEAYTVADMVDDSGYKVHNIERGEVTDGTTTYGIVIKDRAYCFERFPSPLAHTSRPFAGFLWQQKLYLRPVPDDTYAVTLHTRVRPPELDDADTFDIIGVDMALVSLAAAYGLQSLGRAAEARDYRATAASVLGLHAAGDVKDADRVAQGFDPGVGTLPMEPINDPWYGRGYRP